MLDVEILQSLLVKASFVLPVLVGVVGVAKQFVEPRWLPVVALLLGGVCGWVFIAGSATGVLVGLMMGLSSVGLYEFGKTSVLGR